MHVKVDAVQIAGNGEVALGALGDCNRDEMEPPTTTQGSGQRTCKPHCCNIFTDQACVSQDADGSGDDSSEGSQEGEIHTVRCVFRLTV